MIFRTTHLLACIIFGILPFASAASFDPPIYPGASLDDTEMMENVPRRITQFLEKNKQLPGSVSPKTLSSGEALDHVRSWVETSANRDALKTLRGAPQLKTDGNFLAVAAFNLMRNHRPASFLSLYVGLEKFPKSGPLWLNLASVVMMYGKANEGLAMVAEAERLGQLGSGPFGIGAKDTADYVRAYGYMLQGRYAESEKILTDITQRAPELSEANLTLALVKSKLGKSPRPPFIMAIFRGVPASAMMVCGGSGDSDDEKPSDSLPDPLVEGQDVSVSLDQVVDVTKGSPGRLYSFDLPHTPVEFRAMIPTLGAGTFQRNLTATMTIKKASAEAFSRFHDIPYSRWKRRQLTLFSAADMRYPRVRKIYAACKETDRLYRRLEKLKPDIEAKTKSGWATVDARYQPYLDAVMAKMSSTQADTDAVFKQWYDALDSVSQNSINQWLPLATEYHKALEREFELRSQFMSGILAHIGEPNLRQCTELGLQYLRSEYEFRRVNFALHFIGDCIKPRDDRVPKDDGTGSDGHKPGCSAEKSRYSASLDLPELPGIGGLGVEISCSSISLELNVPTGIPGLTISGEIGLDTTGAATVFVGPKGSDLIPVGGATAKGGMYVTVGSDGIRDVGGKYEVKSVAGAPGMVNVNHMESTDNISIIPGPSAVPSVPGERSLPEFTGGNL